MLTAGVLSAAGCGFLFHLMAARGLGPGGYGALTASLTYVALFAIGMEAGIGLTLTREASAAPERLGWTPRLAIWKGRLAVAGVAAAVASAWALGFDPTAVGLIAIMAVGMVGFSGLHLAYAVFRSVGWFSSEAAFSTAQKLVLLPLTAGALALGTGAHGVAVMFTLSYAVTAVPAIRRAWGPVTRVLAQPAGRRDPPAGLFLRTCLPILAIDALTGLYSRVDQVLLLRLRGPEETGLYAAAWRISEVLVMLVTGTMTVLFPRLAASARGPAETFRADFVTAWRALWAGSLVLALNGWLWATGLVPHVFGDAYAPAGPVLTILLVAVPVMYVNYLLTQSLLATGRERFYAVGAAACAAVNLGLNLLAIPVWGAAAAAWVTLATEAVLLVVSLVGLRRIRPGIPVGSTLAAGAAAILAVAVGWWALPGHPAGRLLLAVAASIAIWEAAAPWGLRSAWARQGARRA